MNAAFPPTRTPPPCSARPPVIAPDAGTLLVSVRSPPEAMEITVLLPLPVIVWPLRSRRTVPETTRDSSPASAATSFRSVTVPPASSAVCRLSQVIAPVRHTSPSAMPTRQLGQSLEKCRSSPAAAPEVMTTEFPTDGSNSVVTPMDAPAERPLTEMVVPSVR